MAKTPTRKNMPVKKSGKKKLKKPSPKKTAQKRLRGGKILTNKKKPTSSDIKTSGVASVKAKSKKLPPKVSSFKLKSPLSVRKRQEPLPNPVKLFADHCELPLIYNQTGITLIARDPRWIYAYWEIAPPSLDAMKRKIGPSFIKSIYTLRLHEVADVDVGGTYADHSFDIEIAPSAQSRYIELSRDNGSYFADIGLLTPQGIFLPMARSNIISTPCANVSDSSQMTWMKVKHTEGAPPKIIAQTNASPHSNDDWIKTRDTSVLSTMFQTNDIKLHCDSDTTENNPADKAIALDKPLHGKELPGFYVLLGNTCEAAHPGYDSQENDRQSPNIALSRIELSKEYFPQNIMIGASKDLRRGASEWQQGGSSEQLQKGRGFFFELGTELIVYGRTTPDASVQLDGEVLPLRADGTFSLRFALPEGTLPLHFCAVSKDAAGRKTISGSISRFLTFFP